MSRHAKAGGDRDRGIALRLGAVAAAICVCVTAPGCGVSRGSADRAGEVGEAESARSGDRLAEADALLAEGRTSDALAQLTQVIQENPTLTTAWVKVADIHKEQGNYAQAEAGYRRAGQLDPTNFHAAFNHGLMLQLLDRVAEAVRAYLRAVSLKPEDRDANLNLATAYLQLKETSQALPYAEKAVRVDPEYGPSRVNLGAVYAALERHTDAVGEYEAAAERMDLEKSPELLLNLADSLGKLGRFQEMASTLERLVSIRPTAPAHERLGSAQFRLRQYEAALASFRTAARLDAEHYPAHNGVGVCLLNQFLTAQPERRDKAVRDQAMEAFRRSLQINRNQPRIIELLSKYGG